MAVGCHFIYSAPGRAEVRARAGWGGAQSRGSEDLYEATRQCGMRSTKAASAVAAACQLLNYGHGVDFTTLSGFSATFTAIAGPARDEGRLLGGLLRSYLCQSCHPWASLVRWLKGCWVTLALTLETPDNISCMLVTFTHEGMLGTPQLILVGEL